MTSEENQQNKEPYGCGENGNTTPIPTNITPAKIAAVVTQDPPEYNQTVFQQVCVEADVTITPTVTAGTPIVVCVGNLIVGGCTGLTGFTPSQTGSCTSTFGQVLFVNIPIHFDAHATAVAGRVGWVPASIAPNSELSPLPPGTDTSVPASNAPNNGLTPLPPGTDASVPASNAPNSELTPLPPGTDASVPASNAPNSELTSPPPGTGCVHTCGFFGSSPEGQALTAELIAEFGPIILGQRGSGLSITVSTVAIAANIFANNPPAPAPMNRPCGSARVSEYQQLYAQLLTANLNVLNLQSQDVTVCREVLDLIQGANTFIANSPTPRGTTGAPSFSVLLTSFNEGSFSPNCPPACPGEV